MKRRAFGSSLLCGVALSLCTALPALAQTDEQRAGARSLATEGAAAFNEGRFKDAVDLFSKAESLVHAPPHLLFLARSHAKLSQFVKAREAYLKIIKEQLPANSPQAFRDAQTASEGELSAIEPKIGRLTVKVEGGEGAKDLVVKLDGVPIPPVLVGVPQPADPGEHKVEAGATGFRAQPQAVKLGDGEKAAVTLKLEVDPNAPAPTTDVPAADPAGGAAPAGHGGTAAATTPAASPSDGDTSAGSSGLRIGSYAAFGVGAIGLGLGVVFTLQSSSKTSEADDICNLPGGGCPENQRDKVDQLDADAKSAGTLGVVGFVVGGLGIGAGVTLLILSGGSSSGASGRSEPGITPWVGLNSAGISGRF
jgi:hypothetical protein